MTPPRALRSLVLPVCLAAALPAPGAAYRDPDSGTRGHFALLNQATPRARAMGNAFTAAADDQNALFSNPAGLGRIASPEFFAAQQKTREGVVENHVGGLLSLGILNAENVRNFGALGLDYGYLDYGDFEGRSASGGVTHSFKAREAVWSFGYGRAFGPRIALGASLKRYNFRIDDQRSHGNVYDFGLMFRPVPGRWTAAFASLNNGADTAFETVREELPSALAGGLAFTPRGDRVRLTMDHVRPSGGRPAYRAGGEVWVLNGGVALRAGYDSSYDLWRGWSVGAGINISRFEAMFFPAKNVFIDYAFLPAAGATVGESSPAAGVHSFSLRLRFGD